MNRITSSSALSAARRSRSTGSSSVPFSLRAADDAVELAGEAEQLAEGRTPRSKPSPIATRHPHRLADGESAEVRAPVRNTSLNSEPPVGCSIGRTSTPSWSTGPQERRPLCRSEPGSVARRRQSHCEKCALRRPHLLAVDHPARRRRDVPSSARRRGRSRHRVRVALRPQLSTARIFGRNRCCCSLVPNAVSVGPHSSPR